jgi:hypothetical protein
MEKTAFALTDLLDSGGDESRMWCALTNDMEKGVSNISSFRDLFAGPYAVEALDSRHLSALGDGQYYNDELINGIMQLAVAFLRPSEGNWQVRNTFWAEQVMDGSFAKRTRRWRHTGAETEDATHIWVTVHITKNHWGTFVAKIADHVVLLYDPLGEKADRSLLGGAAVKLAAQINTELGVDTAWTFRWPESSSYPSQYEIDTQKVKGKSKTKLSSCGPCSTGYGLCIYLGRDLVILTPQIKQLRKYMALFFLAGCAQHNQHIWKQVWSVLRSSSTLDAASKPGSGARRE